MAISDQMKQWIREQYNGVALVGKEHLMDENFLMIKKWPAYRFMTPLAATMLFGKEYSLAYKTALRKNVDITIAQNSTAGTTVDFKASNGRATQMWIARKRADASGLHYPEYLEFCFDFAMRRIRNQLPQPNQLVPSVGTAGRLWNEKLAEFWDPDRQLLALARMPFMPQYQDAKGRDLPARDVLLDQLLSLQSHAGNFEDFLGSYVLAKGYLDQKDLANKFSPDVISMRIDGAIRSGTWTRLSEPVDDVDFHQACHGLPGVVKGQEELCEICPARTSCVKLRGMVEGLLMKTIGSHDPVLDQKRAKNRDDVRRHRARKKAGTLPGGSSSAKSRTTAS